MRTNRQAPYPYKMPGSVSGASGAQATLILLVLILLLVLMAKSTIGDAIVSAAGEFVGFRVWGTENNFDSAGNSSRTGSNTTSPYDASVVSVDMPALMTQGTTSAATITMKNTGIANWYADGSSTVMLEAVGGISSDAYRFARTTDFRMATGTVVRRGEACAFKFNIVAPAAGQYRLEFQMSGDEAGRFGEIAGKNITVVPTPTPTPAPTPAPTIAPTPVPTYPPYEAYVAYGKFALYDKYGRRMIGGPWLWIYDGPFGRSIRSSYFSEPSWPYPDWDIGGPNGQYYIFKEGCIGSGSFSMNYGGNKGTIIFRFIN